VTRTKDLLLSALFSLGAERPWERITVAALCRRARIHRSTFYDSFEGKEDLLDRGLTAHFDLLVAGFGAGPEPTMEGQLVRMLDHGREHRQFYHRALAEGGIRTLLGEYLVRHAREAAPGMDPGLVRLGAAAILEAFSSFVAAPSPEPAAEVARTLARFLAGGLGAKD